MDTPMFCFQCQETAGCKGCTRSGVCGKTLMWQRCRTCSST